MELPNTISQNTMKCYQLQEGFYCAKPHALNCCQNFGQWCRNFPKTLKELCIISISENWTDYPILEEILLPEDRCMLLDKLPEDLPLELTVPKIEDNMYWKKCFLKKWPLLLHRNVIEKNMFVFPSLSAAEYERSAEIVEKNSTTSETYSTRTEHDEYCSLKTWKEYYLENHVKVFLENLEPDGYEPEEIKKLCDICGPHVRTLHLDELKCHHGDELVHGGTRIALNAVLTGLPKLQEVSICFKQKYVGFNNFSWNVIHLSLQDIKLLSKGLEKIRLHNLRLFNSDFEGTKCIPVLKAMLKYDNLKTLDFSYSNIGDHGASLVSKFAMEVKIEELFLVDNNIGSIGGEALAYILNSHLCSVQKLNLRMNPIGSKSGNMILTSLLENKSLKSLNLVACNVRVNKVITELLLISSTLEELYLSNNPIGDEIGNLILNSLNFNRSLNKLDLRMCCIHSEVQQKISERIKEGRLKNFSYIETRKNGTKLEFSKSFLSYFENIRICEEQMINDEMVVNRE